MRPKSLYPFNVRRDVAPTRPQGGSRPEVQASADALQESSRPSIASRIYAPAAVRNYDQDDPRYDGKSDAVENIYLKPSATPQAKRGFFDKLKDLFNG